MELDRTNEFVTPVIRASGFDLSAVKPENERVIVFYVSGSYLHFRNIEVVGTQVTIVGHTQSECFRNEGEVIISTNICRCMTVWRSASI